MNDTDKTILEGFNQGRNIAYYFDHSDEIPNCPGVYAIVYEIGKPKAFLEQGSGGRLDGREPNVSIRILEQNWVEGTQILYIGKANNLRKRLRQYFHFGQGKPCGHWGGRFIWQLENAEELLVFWQPTPETPPEIVESLLIKRFKCLHNGKRPFANLRD